MPSDTYHSYHWLPFYPKRFAIPSHSVGLSTTVFDGYCHIFSCLVHFNAKCRDRKKVPLTSFSCTDINIVKVKKLGSSLSGYSGRVGQVNLSFPDIYLAYGRAPWTSPSDTVYTTLTSSFSSSNDSLAMDAIRFHAAQINVRVIRQNKMEG